MAKKSVADQLRKAAKASDRTGADLAEACGLNESTLSRFKRGHGNPQLDSAELLARALGGELKFIPPKKTRKRKGR